MNEDELEEALLQRSAFLRSQIVCESKYIDRFESILVSRAHLLRHLVIPAELHKFSARRSSALYKDSPSSFSHVFYDTKQYPIVRDAIGPFVCRAVPLNERTQTDELSNYGVALVQILNCRLSNGIGYLETLKEVQQRAKNLLKMDLQTKGRLSSDFENSALNQKDKDQPPSLQEIKKDGKLQSQEQDAAIKDPVATKKGFFDIDDTIAVIQALDIPALENDLEEISRYKNSSVSDLTSEKPSVSRVLSETHTSEGIDQLPIEETPQAHCEASDAQEYSLETLGEDETCVDNLSEVGFEKYLKSSRQSDNSKKFSNDDDDNWEKFFTAEDFQQVEVEDIRSGSSLSECSSSSTASSTTSSSSTSSSQRNNAFQRRNSQDSIPEDIENQSNALTRRTSSKSQSSGVGYDDHVANRVHLENRRARESFLPTDEIAELRSRQQHQEYLMEHINTSLLQICDDQRSIANTLRRMESRRFEHNNSYDLSLNQACNPYPQTRRISRPPDWMSCETKTDADSRFGRTLKRKQELEYDTKSMDGILFGRTHETADQFSQLAGNHRALGSVFNSREKNDLDTRIQACLRRSQSLFESYVKDAMDPQNNGVARHCSNGTMHCRSCSSERWCEKTRERSLEALEVAENERHQEITRLISRARLIG